MQGPEGAITFGTAIVWRPLEPNAWKGQKVTRAENSIWRMSPAAVALPNEVAFVDGLKLKLVSIELILDG